MRNDSFDMTSHHTFLETFTTILTSSYISRIPEILLLRIKKSYK